MACRPSWKGGKVGQLRILSCHWLLPVSVHRHWPPGVHRDRWVHKLLQPRCRCGRGATRAANIYDSNFYISFPNWFPEWTLKMFTFENEPHKLYPKHTVFTFYFKNLRIIIYFSSRCHPKFIISRISPPTTAPAIHGSKWPNVHARNPGIIVFVFAAQIQQVFKLLNTGGNGQLTYGELHSFHLEPSLISYSFLCFVRLFPSGTCQRAVLIK